MNKYRMQKRILEIIPGAVSWLVIIILVVLAFLRPVSCAVFIIIFDFYWIIRTLYLTMLLAMGHRQLHLQKDKDWLAECNKLNPSGSWHKIYHLVILPTYNEGLDILRPSLDSLARCSYPKDKMIVVVAFEARNLRAKEDARILEEEFKPSFFGYLSTFHPDGVPGESRTKGANATWAARQAKDFIAGKGIPYEDVIVSCFDADTCVEKNYFNCLTYHFLVSPKPHQASYQPIPVYNNNIWYAPAFARIVEISSSFCQMIESMRLEKFVTFSSHSMSFKTLIKIDYWPVDMISDDSVVYWKAYLYYKGNYHVVPLYITVSMDAAYSSNLLKTIAVQYKQKRRWAWGIENFPYVAGKFLASKDIPLLKKARRIFHLLESNITWAVWAIILMLIAPLPIFLGGVFFAQMPIGYNLPRITGMLFNFTVFASLIWLLLSKAILPPRPKDVGWVKSLIMVIEWVIALPFIILILGSLPALDAQTRLMLGKYMQFQATEKKRPRLK